MCVCVRSTGSSATGDDARRVSYNTMLCMPINDAITMLIGAKLRCDMAYHMAITIVPYRRSTGSVIHIPSMVASGSEAIAWAPLQSSCAMVLVALSSHVCDMCKHSSACIPSAMSTNGVRSGVNNRLESRPQIGM